MDGGGIRLPAEIEAAVKQVSAMEDRAAAALLLAAIANRAAAALHQLARTEANARKGQPDWGRWASLTNASRDAVLRTATSRQTASQLGRAGREETSPG
jgi:hypothetical protein